MTKQMIAIDNEVYEVTDLNELGYYMLTLDDKTEWYIFQDSESAGEAAREYWEDLVRIDPQEFTCLVGEETLVSWALGQSAGPGSTAVNSLQEWLDLWLDTPEEHFASYDGNEVECRISKSLQDELGFTNSCVCYRHN